jgi:UDP-N-acetylglucosamine--N-acetylmuramyl-(pentapeptide) pyrophosphoryl-undecaprenol N-acetylglucosamine transferase
MTPNNSPLLVFTGGHHSSALALALELRKKGWQIYWIGHRHSQWQDTSDSAEYREVTAQGVDFFDLKAGKIYRTFHPLKLLRLPWGFIMAFYILLNLKLRFGRQLKGIVTFGGYLGVPVVFCGWILGLKVLAHEQTAVAGWANRFIALFAKKIALTWPSSKSYYPAQKTVVTGLPLRQEIIRHSSNLDQNKIKDQIYITGGKQGSHVINEAIFSALGPLLKNHSLIHQTGSSSLFNDYQKALDLRQILPDEFKKKYKVLEYLDSEAAARALSSSELVISRSGAHIIQELAVFKTKCILIPIPWSSHDEQLSNAGILETNRQAVILPQSQLNGKSLQEAVDAAAKLKPENLTIITNGLQNMIQLIEQMFK